MKQLSLSLIIILFAAAVSYASQAKQSLLIYSYTEKAMDYTCENDVWQKTNTKRSGYIAMEERYDSGMDMWFVNTWKAPDVNGTMQKHAKPEKPKQYSIDYADIGLKEIWIMNFIDSNEHIFLKGDEKHLFIQAVDKYANIPSLLTGTHNWYRTKDNVLHAGSSTMSLKFHSKFTNDYYSDPNLINAAYAIEGIIGKYLLDKGYIIFPLILE